MIILNNILIVLNNTVGAVAFGIAVRYMMFEEYKIAAWILLCVAIPLVLEHMAWQLIT